MYSEHEYCPSWNIVVEILIWITGQYYVFLDGMPTLQSAYWINSYNNSLPALEKELLSLM